MVRWLIGLKSNSGNSGTSTLRLLNTLILHDGDLMERGAIKWVLPIVVIHWSVLSDRPFIVTGSVVSWINFPHAVLWAWCWNCSVLGPKSFCSLPVYVVDLCVDVHTEVEGVSMLLIDDVFYLWMLTYYYRCDFMYCLHDIGLMILE